MTVKTLGTLLELAGVCALTGIAYGALEREKRVRKELTCAMCTIDLADLVITAQKKEIDKLAKEVKNLKKN